ncbi:MAG: hypothetical protein ACYS47_02160, partial [Planctomycetota bacterium]
MKTSIKLLPALVVALALAGAAFAQAPSIPKEISFQGKLTDTTGNPITSAVDLRFTLWDASSGGNSLWTETLGGITPDGNGLYNVMLGGVTPFTVNFDNPYWLEVEVTPAGTMNWESLSPRYQLGASPYAMTAANLEGLTVSVAAINQALTGINIGGMVTGASLENLTDGTNADALHSHTIPTDADTVDSLHASATATANMLYPLDANALFPVAVITQGSGSTLDADLLDGQDSAAFAASGHTHATYVDLASAQTITGVKTFNPSAGTVPFAVDASKTGMVQYLNADQVDGQDASAFALASHTHANYLQKNVTDGWGHASAGGTLTLGNSAGGADTVICPSGNNFYVDSTITARRVAIGFNLDSAPLLVNPASAANGAPLTTWKVGGAYRAWVTDRGRFCMRTLNAGTRSKTADGVVYNYLSNQAALAPTAAAISNEEDLFVDGDVEIDGGLYLDGSLTVASSAMVGNLNADRVDGLHASSFATTGHTHANYVDLASAQTITGVKSFNTASGTVPFAVSATDNGIVTNLNADRVDGQHASDFARLNAANTFGAFIQNFDSGTLYLDPTNNRVGIVDTTPTYTLDVNGTFRAVGAGYFNNDFRAGGNTLFVDLSSTRVGINDLTPTYPLDVMGDIRAQGGRLRSTVATGTPPLAVASTTMVSNLNADRVDGSHASSFATASHNHLGEIWSGTPAMSGLEVTNNTVSGSNAGLYGRRAVNTAPGGGGIYMGVYARAEYGGAAAHIGNMAGLYAWA